MCLHTLRLQLDFHDTCICMVATFILNTHARYQLGRAFNRSRLYMYVAYFKARTYMYYRETGEWAA